MGPCLWGTEYNLSAVFPHSPAALQWGRAFGARNTQGARQFGRVDRRFNGAVPLGHGIQLSILA